MIGNGQNTSKKVDVIENGLNWHFVEQIWWINGKISTFLTLIEYLNQKWIEIVA